LEKFHSKKITNAASTENKKESGEGSDASKEFKAKGGGRVDCRGKGKERTKKKPQDLLPWLFERGGKSGGGLDFRESDKTIVGGEGRKVKSRRAGKKEKGGPWKK